MAKKKFPLIWTVAGKGEAAVHTLTVKDLHTSIEVRIGGDSKHHPWIAGEDGVPWFARRWRTVSEARKGVEDTVMNGLRSR